MTKTELVSAVHQLHASTLNKTATATLVDDVIDAISKAIAKEGRLVISGLGTFTVKERKARNGLNPKTREAITIPASKTVRFKPAPALKDAL